MVSVAMAVGQQVAIVGDIEFDGRAIGKCSHAAAAAAGEGQPSVGEGKAADQDVAAIGNGKRRGEAHSRSGQGDFFSRDCNTSCPRRRAQFAIEQQDEAIAAVADLVGQAGTLSGQRSVGVAFDLDRNRLALRIGERHR